MDLSLVKEDIFVSKLEMFMKEIGNKEKNLVKGIAF